MPSSDTLSAILQFAALTMAFPIAFCTRFSIGFIAILCGLLMWCSYVFLGDDVGPGMGIGIPCFPLMAGVVAYAGRLLAVQLAERKSLQPRRPVDTDAAGRGT